MEEDVVDFRVEIRILQFWRGLLGEDQFARYAQADLVRWYLALELAGPVDIRALLAERQGSRPMPVLQGVVPTAPHPPTPLIEDWLNTYEAKVRTGSLWYGMAAFVGLTFMIGLFTSTCSLDTTTNPLAMNPRPTAPPAQTPTVKPVQSFGNLPNNNPAAPTLPAAAGPTPGVPSVISAPQAPAGPAGSAGSASSGGSGNPH